MTAARQVDALTIPCALRVEVSARGTVRALQVIAPAEDWHGIAAAVDEHGNPMRVRADLVTAVQHQLETGRPRAATLYTG